MYIAIIIRRLDVKGGTQRQALSLANELRRRGHKVALYAIFYSKEKCYPDLLEGFSVTALAGEFAPVRRRPAPLGYLDTISEIRRDTQLARELAMNIDREVDILNPHDRVAHRAAYFFKRLVKRVPSVWNTNDTHSMRWVVDKLVDINPKYRQPFWKRFAYLLRDWYENWRYIEAQDAIVVVDYFNRGLVKKYFGREAITVRNGPNLEHFSYRERTPPGKSPKLLTSGIFFPHRRFEDAIGAVRFLRGWGYDPALSIIGNTASDQPYAEKLKRLVTELGMADRVHFLGKVSEEELVRQYHGNDIFLYPHHLQSDGLSPFEALSCGMPVIASRSAGAHEILTDRETGMIVDPKSPEGIARAIQDMIDSPELYKKLSAGGAEFVRSNFSWQRYTDGILKVYEQVIAKVRSGEN